MGTTFVIEDGIPLPQGRVKYPLAELKVGQSFFVPKDSRPIDRIQRTLKACCTNAHKRNGATFRTSRSATPEGVRVWRIA